MSGTAQPMRKIGPKPPDKGSFPLDHFHECDKQADMYNKCLQKHQLMPKRCRKYQMDYLDCRMQSGLMDQEEFQKLGFTEESSWENEEQEQMYLFNKIQKVKQQAYENAKKQAEYIRQKQAQEKTEAKTNE